MFLAAEDEKVQSEPGSEIKTCSTSRIVVRSGKTFPDRVHGGRCRRSLHCVAVVWHMQWAESGRCVPSLSDTGCRQSVGKHAPEYLSVTQYHVTRVH